MKIDRKFRKTLSEIPADCKQLIEKLKSSVDNDALYNELCSIKTWNIGKCELYHWADVLDRFDSILEQAASKLTSESWQLSCDLQENAKLKKLLLSILQFTALLIEHSYSRHLYNSTEHLTILLESIDFHVILSVLNLLYVFSKRSIFINRLAADKKQALIQRLLYLAESWGGKENGLDLVKCCTHADLSNFAGSATTVNFEYQIEAPQQATQQVTSETTSITKLPATKVIRLEKVHQIHENPAVIMERVVKEQEVPEDKRVLLYTYLRLAHSFPNYEKRKLFVQTRLQSLSILVYSGAITDHANNLLYDGLIEELVDVLTVKELHGFSFPEIKAASLKTLTAIIHLEKINKLNEIIETTQASSYYGLLPTLVRKCVDHLIDSTKEPFPHQFATSLFSFLYHLATYDTGGDALVKCGIMETLLKVVNHNQNSQEYIMFVTRAVRVIDLITNLDMTSFEGHQGLVAFISRLEYEVNECRKEQPYVIKVKRDLLKTQQPQDESSPASPIQTDVDQTELDAELERINGANQPVPGITCYHQRSALLKSILNFFKKAIADSSNNNVPNLGDSIRHMMEASLPNSLKHIISNADYYGPSLFLLATDVVQLFIFQEPSQLSQLQENGLTDVILFALLKKNVPATREVLGSLPTVFSALCLNTAGLNAFIASKPFDKLFQVLLSPDYLPAMRRRRTQDQLNGGNNSANQQQAHQASSSGTASQLGSAMDELMRHQPSLRIEAMNSIIKLLNRLIEMGKNPSYVCQRQSASSALKPPTTAPTTISNRRNRRSQQQEGGAPQQQTAQSSEDENDDDYENTMMVVDAPASTVLPSVVSAPPPPPPPPPAQVIVQKPLVESVPLLDYITNIMKFIEAILSNNSTDDHCKEFVKQKGLQPLLQILSLPNLPIDFPNSSACQSVSQVCKSILNLAREPFVIEYTLTNLIEMFTKCEPLVNACKNPLEGSLLIKELAESSNPLEAINDPLQTPLLHALCGIHSFVYLLITLGKTSQNEIRNLTIHLWGADDGIRVLKDLCKLYMALIWESSILLWLCNEEAQLPQNESRDVIIQNFDYNKVELEKLRVFLSENETFSVSEKMDDGAAQPHTTLPQTTQSQQFTFSKLLRPLFTCASKLGRSLCELFSLLVKLSAGSPWKSQNQRRNQLQPQQQQPQNQPPQSAINVASTLSDLANASLITQFAHSTSINPKFRLTFYICSVAFTSSILFDELKRPYHLTLKHFDECGGLKSFFHAFTWSLDYLNTQAQNDKDKIQEGTLEFIESWLNLIQKLVNTKNMLETRHALAAPKQSSAVQPNPTPATITFDPIKFLFKVHKETFNALMNLWDKKFVKENNLSETLLNILCQILIGDSQLQKKLAEREILNQTQTLTQANEIQINPFVRHQPQAPQQPAPNATNQDSLLQMVAMGFSSEQATEALDRFPESLENAIEFCFNNPPSTTPNQPLAQVPAQASLVPQAQVEVKPAQVEEAYHQLDKNILDNFANSMLPGLFRILDNVPETVYRVCDLIVVLIRKYGETWRNNCLNFILNETLENIKVVSAYYQSTSTTKPENIDQKLASRLLLFSLLFEEMQLSCAKIVNSSDLLDKLVQMLNLVSLLEANHPNDLSKLQTPTWLTSLFILIDLIEKASLATKRKAHLNDMYTGCNRVWKWYEERQNRWISYPYANNKTIDEAYRNGDSHLKIVASRKSYLITFNSMLQINEETSHKRPIMLCFEKPSSTSSTQTTSEGDAVKVDDTEQPTRPSSPLPIELVRGLVHDQIKMIIEKSVSLIALPISDSDCLHAILRIVLRLTRHYEYAIQFASLKGPQHILNLTQKNSFMGYASLVTLIFRHICENESNLRLTMEKAIRLALSGSQSTIGLSQMGVGSREIHNVMRILGPAICRHPDLFCEVACDILRIVIRREDESLTAASNLNTSQSYSLRALQAKLMPLTSLPEYAHELVLDLLNYLVQVIPQQDPKSKDIDKSKQPLLSKSGILRILSELIRSYAGCAKIVTSHTYKQGQSEILTDDSSTLAFVLDHMLPPNQTFGDKDCSSLSRLLVVALASCNHCLDSQNALVNEVKLALNRAILLPESNDKHIKLQSISGIINTMIETCPTIQTQNQAQQTQNGQQQPPRQQPQQNIVNNMMKIMHKKGLINDLAHVPHSIDLSSTKAIETINSLLKPLETMTKTLNIASRKREIQQPKVGQSSDETTNQQVHVTYSQQQQQQEQQSSNQQNEGGTQSTNQDGTHSSNEEQMVDLNMTEMEPQQALPQDVDMPSMHAPARRDLEDRVLDVIDALNQEGETDDSDDDDDEYDEQNGLIHIDGDENNDPIRIQIEEEHNDGDDDENDDVDLSEENGSGEDDDMHLGGFEEGHGGEHEDEDDESNSTSEPTTSDSDHDDDDDVDGDEEDIEDDEAGEEDMVEGSDGRSAVSSYASDEEHEGIDRANNADTIEDAVANALANVSEAGRRRSRDQQGDNNDEDDDENDEDDEHDDDEEMELDEEDDEGEIIEEDDEENDDEGDDDDGDEDDVIDENDEEEDEHDDTSEYYDVYNQMIDFMNETNEGEDEDILMHFEGLWQNPAHHLVLGSGTTNNRAIQIAVGSGLSGDPSLPPHPLSVSVTHPLLAHHGENSNLPSSNLQLQNASRMRQPAQMRSRISRFIIPGLNLQLTANIPTPQASNGQHSTQQMQAQQPQLQSQQQQQPPQNRQSNLPYNTLSEILQGFEAPIVPASYDMLVNGLYNNQLTAGQEFMAYNEGNEGNGPTNLYIIRTPLARWNEECTVLDAHSMHHAILLVKPKILEILEKYRNEELAEKREKRAKEQAKLAAEEKERQARVAAAVEVTTANAPQQQQLPSQEQQPPDQAVIEVDTQRIEEQPVVEEPNQTPNMSMSVESVQTPAQQQITIQEVIQEELRVEQVNQQSTPSNVSIEAATAFLVAHLSGTCNIFTLNSDDEKLVAIEALRISEHQQASVELNDIQIVNYPQNFVFMNERVIILPPGIDPSFLSALPDNLRREVIMEQLRIEGIDILARPQTTLTSTTSNTTQMQQPQVPTEIGTATGTGGTPAPANAIEINPEFLAALPPQIQEELLTQQRLEQQAQNPAAQDDNTAFMRALPASLRQAILFDMDQSQIAALPEDLAQEAQALQRQHREREMDLFAAAAAHRSNALFGNRYTISSTNRFYNAASTLLADGYLYGGPRGTNAAGTVAGGAGNAGGERLRRGFRRIADGEMNPLLMDKLSRGGRQLLDHESLACLLVLLFMDDQRLSTVKFHRVVRNLCIHGPSRAWIIRALLSILEKVCGKPESDKLDAKKKDLQTYQPSWLTMSIDGAFGSKTNVFTINRVNNSKKSQTKLLNDNNTSITINPQACPSIIKQVLDILSTLARAANFNFFPKHPFKQQQPQVQSQTPSKSQSQPQFWDLIVKLDQSKNKVLRTKISGAALNTSSSNLVATVAPNQANSNENESDHDFSIDNSPLARLLSMLEYSLLKSSSSLMDKIFTCLAHASAGIQLQGESDASQVQNEPVLVKQIELVVNVLKNKLCTQDGLNQAYILLNNLSKINSATRNMIIKHLLEGTRELGFAVCQEIDTLLEEAHVFNAQKQLVGGGEVSGGASSVGEQQSMEQGTYEPYITTNQQNLIDRYSNLVISSPKQQKVHELQLPSMNKLVEKNSNQKFFVRLIKLIIQLRETIEKEAKKKRQQQAATAADPQQQPQESALNRLSAELELDVLWNKLSQCLTTLKSLSDPYAVLILQQTVEAFFYVHATRKDKEETKRREKETKEAQLAHLDSEAPMSPSAGPTLSDLASTKTAEIETILNTIGNEAPDTKKFLEFALTHRTVLNHILRQTSNNLSDEPFSVLVDFTRLHTHILDFDVKRRYFRQELDKLKDSIRAEDLAVHVKRSQVFDDSYRELNRRAPDDWKHRFYIVFEGEEGQDAGGLLREWYMIISKEIFNPDYALYMINPGDRVTYMPNPSSHFNPNHLSYFKFIGHIIAKAIFDNKYLDCYFTRAFYKQILGVPVKYTDMESVDNEFYKNLVSILESDLDTLGVDLTFSIDINEFGVTKSVDLKPDGHSVRVTNENKAEYVRLVCQEKMIGSIRQQVSAFLQGFYEIIPKNLISIFNEQELELLISGLPEIDLEDLRRNTEYHKYTSNSLQIQWFWRALKSFDKDDQAKFLQFVTGTSKVPLQGFAKLEGMNGPQKFQIHRDDRDTSRLPCAHTCFNQLDLPAYENFEKLRTMLLMAIRECSTGFGLA